MQNRRKQQRFWNRTIPWKLVRALVLAWFLTGITGNYLENGWTMTAYAQGTEKNTTQAEPEKLTIQAAVSDGLLQIQVSGREDGETSHVQAIYVNGYEFAAPEQGILTIRLQQFDAGYPYFILQAKDTDGNLSERYKVENPYYSNPDRSDSSDHDSAGQLPAQAGATEPSEAKAVVTEKSGQEKEFYTIQTKTGKVFYLILEKKGEEEIVSFLTEVSERDLLNVTGDTNETLPKNSAVLEVAVPGNEGRLPEGNEEGNQEKETTESKKETETEEKADSFKENPLSAEPSGTEAETKAGEKTEKEGTPAGIYLMLILLVASGVGVWYYCTIVKKRKENFLEEDEEEEYEEEEDDEENRLEEAEENYLENVQEETHSIETKSWKRN